MIKLYYKGTNALGGQGKGMMSMSNMMAKKYRTLALTVVAGLLGSGVALAADAQTTVEQSISQDQARAELERAEARGQVTAPEAVPLNRITVPVSAVEIEPSAALSERAVRTLLPELRRDRVRVHQLSKEIQLVNDTGAARLKANLYTQADGTFRVHIGNTAGKKAERTSLSVSNSGTEYTSDWRATLSYINRNISHRADSLGVAYVTAPNEHIEDVQQFALSYRTLLPEIGGALLVNASYSDIDLGNIAPAAWRGLLDYTAAGKGTNVGVHYQQHIAYTAREKDIIDIGLDYKRSRSDVSISLAGTGTSIDIPHDYSILLGSLGFIHNDRSNHHSFSYDVSIAANAHGDAARYTAAAPGSKEKFALVRASAAYQVRSKSDWIIGARLAGQYTEDHLVTLAQLGAGGQTSVRGFYSNALTADTGVVGTIELYTPEIMKNSRLVAFADGASLANNTSSATSCFGTENIASVGLGYRYTDRENGWYASLDWAAIVDDIDAPGLSKARHPWQLTVTKSF